MTDLSICIGIITLTCIGVLFLFAHKGKHPSNEAVLFTSREEDSPIITLANLKAQEELERNYRLEEYWQWMGDKISKPTPEQLRDVRLARVCRWVKR